MIEQAIYFALGCIVMALLALLAMPVLWSRALRLSRKRLQLQVPLSMQEILAERDHLRARHAVERLRFEQAAARVQAGKDADLVAIGRGTVEASRLAEEVEAFRKLNEAQGHEIALLATAVAEHKVESSALRQDLAAAHTSVEGLRGEAEAAMLEHARLAEEGEGHRTSAAALVARLAEHEEAQATIVRLEEDLVIVRGERDAERDRQKGFYLGNSLRVDKERIADRAAASVSTSSRRRIWPCAKPSRCRRCQARRERARPMTPACARASTPSASPWRRCRARSASVARSGGRRAPRRVEERRQRTIGRISRGRPSRSSATKMKIAPVTLWTVSPSRRRRHAVTSKRIEVRPVEISSA